MSPDSIPNLMIVEDDLDIQTLFKLRFAAKGYDVVSTAASGLEAVQIYEESNKKPDIIIMDYKMPGMNGLDAMRVILKANPNAKVIIISADYTVRDKTVKGGAVAFLEKPIDFDAIDLIIAKVLAK